MEKKMDNGRMQEAELNAESANAATFYMDMMKLNHLGMAERQEVLNYIATGFAMGVRWHETKVKNDNG